MTNHARSGRAFEHEVRTKFRDAGYTVVRSAGSKTPIDLVAFAPDDLVLIQCKRHGREGRVERLALLRIAACLPEVTTVVVADRDGPRGGALRLWRITGKDPKAREPYVLERVAA